MIKGLPKTCRWLLSCLVLLGLVVALNAYKTSPAEAAAGINQQINFQGRLLNSQGATVPDGYYNIQFKIYQDGDGQSVGNSTGSPAGSLKWTESHLNASSQGVMVKNGYFSVQLGAITAFGSSIDWNQDTLWLSLNIGNTNASCSPFSSCSPDGEMTPMKRLSSTPYSLNSGLLGGLSSAQFVQLAQGLQTDASNNNSIYINKTGSGNALALQSSGADAFFLTNTGNISFGANASHTISVATSGSGVAGRSLTLTAGGAGTGASALAGGDLVLQGGTGGGTNGNGGNITLNAGVKNGSGTDGTISIGTTTASAISIGKSGVTTTINGTFNAANGPIQLGGTTVVDASRNLTNIGTISSGLINSQTISSAANFTGTLTVQGNSLTLGVGGPSGTTGRLKLANTTTGRMMIIQGQNPSGSGDAIVEVPTIAGGNTDTFCLQTLANCTSNFISTASGTQNYLTKYTTAGTQIGNSQIFDNGSKVIVGGSNTTGAELFNVGNANQFKVTSGGAVTAVGVDSGIGLIQGTGGLTVSGNITFSSINTAGILHVTNTGLLSSSLVTLGTDTSGDYIADLGTLTGLTATDTGGAGSTPTLSVTYGSSANTSVQGNVTLTCPSGTGNLSGTGNSITLGTGGSCTSLTMVNNPTFSGLVTANGGLAVANANTFTNAGATLNTAVSITNKASGGDIGTAAATVDAATSFNVNQTTGSQTLTLPSPTTTTAGRIVYVNNVGSVSFTMYNAVIANGEGRSFVWNGTAWTRMDNVSAGTGLSQVGNVISSSAATSVTSDTNIQGSIGSNTLTLSWSGTLSVARGGTGASTFASNGILYGNSGGALQATTAAANAVLVTDASNVPSLSTTLPLAVQGAITKTGDLAAGSLVSGFGSIFSLAASTGSPVAINGGTTVSLLRGSSNNLTTTVSSGAVTVEIVNNPTFSGAVSAGSLLTATIDTASATTLGIGNSTTNLIWIGKLGVSTTNVGSFQIGNAVGSGTVFTNTGATLNRTLALGNFSSGGSIGSAASTVDVYTSISINQSTSNQTLTIPNPTVTTTGRLLYISNVGSTPFTILGASLSNGVSATLIWNGSAWTFAGADGSSILNQSSADQTANFRISGTGQANTSLLTPLLDTASAGALALGTTNATSINLNQNTTIASGKTLTVNGATTISTTNASALQIQNASNLLFKADTSTMRVGIGTSSPIASFTVAGLVPSASLGNYQSGSGAMSKTGDRQNMVVQGRYAYMIDYFSGSTTVNQPLRIVDISNPASPAFIGSINTVTGGHLAVSGRYAYVASGSALKIYDVSNPASPSLASTTSYSGGSPGGIAVSGRYLYVGNSSSTGIFVFDISNPGAPAQVGTVSDGIMGLDVQGKYLYAASTSGFRVYDISTPSSPSLVSTQNTSTFSSIAPVHAFGRYVYVASTALGQVKIYDVKDPSSVTITNNIAPVVSSVTDIAIQGRYAYITSSTTGNDILYYYDISTPSSPSLVGSVSVPYTTSAHLHVVQATGRYVYTYSWQGFYVFEAGGTSYEQSAEIGNAEIGNLQVRATADIFGQTNIRGSLNVSSTAQFAGDIGVGGTALFKSSSTTGFQIQNTSGRTLLGADTSGGIITIGNTTDGAQITLGATGNANSAIRKTMVVNGTITANDLVEIDTSNAGQVKQAVANSSKIFGIATSATGSGSSQDIVISGLYQVNADSSGGTIAVGDLLISSGTAGVATKAGSTTNPGTVIGLAMSTLSGGKVWVYLNLGIGGSDNLQTAYTKSTGSTTPEIKVDSTRGGLDIQDSDGGIGGSLLTVRAGNAGGLGTALFDIQSSGAIAVGSTSQTASILLGQSTASNTISLGSSVGNGNTQTINVGTSSTAGSATNITIGSNVAGTTIIRGAGGISFTDNTTISSGKLLTLGTSTTLGGSCTNGAIYYDTTNNRFKGCENSTWANMDNYADVQNYTSGNNTWTKPTNVTAVQVIMVGGGGGGGGGGARNGGQERSGGGGGGGGAYVSQVFAASDLASSANASVGSAGSSGGGAASSGSNGSNGGVGGNSCFSTSASCGGTVYAVAYGGGGGAGGGGASPGLGGGGGGGGTAAAGSNSTTATGGTGGNPVGASAGSNAGGGSGGGGGTGQGGASLAGGSGGNAEYGGGGGGATAGSNLASGAGGSSLHGAGGGGAGASTNSGNSTGTAGTGGSGQSYSSGGGGAAGTSGAACASGGNASNGSAGSSIKAGSGGGGGGANGGGGAAGCNGGNGGAPGGGGGGGGSGSASAGAGGTGGAGQIWIISW